MPSYAGFLELHDSCKSHRPVNPNVCVHQLHPADLRFSGAVFHCRFGRGSDFGFSRQAASPGLANYLVIRIGKGHCWGYDKNRLLHCTLSFFTCASHYHTTTRLQLFRNITLTREIMCFCSVCQVFFFNIHKEIAHNNVLILDLRNVLTTY